MVTPPTCVELERRVRAENAHYNGAMPERTALAWHGYLAALIEFGLISVVDHDRLTQLLPGVDDNPVVAILLGRGHTATPRG